MARAALRIAALLLSLAVLGAACDDEDPPPGADGSPGVSSASPSASTKPGKKDGKKEENGDDERTVRVPGGATLTSLPPKAEEICIKGPPLSRACPLLVPEVRGTSYLVESFGRPGGRFQVLELTAGAPSNNDFSRNAPPRVAHVVVEVGKPGFLIDLGEPITTDQSLDAALKTDHDQALVLEPEKRWDWDAELVLALSFPSGGAHGDHLMYSWKEGGYEHRISLHAWTPGVEAVRTLHALIRSARSP